MLFPAWSEIPIAVSFPVALLWECLEQTIADEFLEPLGNVRVIAAECFGSGSARQKEVPPWPVHSLKFQTQSEKPSHVVAVVLLCLSWPCSRLHFLPNHLDNINTLRELHTVPSVFKVGHRFGERFRADDGKGSFVPSSHDRFKSR